MAAHLTPSLKYAVVERERRFLPTEMPDVSEATRVLNIHDRYLTGSRLRLRTVHETGEAPVHKLGQKVRLDPDDPFAVAHTTMYLDRGEYDVLLGLAAASLDKRRHVVALADGLDAAVDVFGGTLTGLVLVEVDLGPHRQRASSVPDWLGPEVTGTESFTGRALAGLDADGLARLLGSHGRDPARRPPSPG
jgi:CYTH domain-containing protein